MDTLDRGLGPLRELLTDAPEETRRRLYRTIVRRRRADLADGLVDEVRARYGDDEAARLLPVCGAATSTRLLPELGYALASWERIARRHPAATLTTAARELAELSPEGREEHWRRTAGAVLAAAEERPEQGLDLLERFAPARWLPGHLTAYGVLASTDPLRVLALFTAPERADWVTHSALPPNLLDRIGRLPPATAAELGRRYSGRWDQFARLLRAAPPGHRGELFERSMAGVDRSRVMTSDLVLAVLPGRARAAEARRMLALEWVRQDERQALRLTAQLPWAEAEPVLLAATGRGTADERQLAWHLLGQCAARGRDPEAVAAFVRHLPRLRNEQDPVRAAALAQLPRLPPALLAPELAEPLDRVVSDVVAARDASGDTISHVLEAAATVLRERLDSAPLTAWALRTFGRVLGDDRPPRFGPLDERLRHDQEELAFAAVRDWLTGAAARGEHGPLFAFAEALGRRAWRLPELQALLGAATRRDTLAWPARRAIELWLADPAQRGARVEAVLREDPSAIALPVVWRIVCARRAGLVAAALAGPPPRGRFIPEGVTWVPPRALGLRRWPEESRRAYAGRLAAVAADASLPWRVRAAALRAAAPVPEHGWPVVRPWTGPPAGTAPEGEEDDDGAGVGMAEAALAALAWTDRPAEALPVLLAHAGDDRARVAMAAAGRAGRFVAPSRLGAALAAVDGKVTSRKEAVRLIAAGRVPGAAGLLWERWSDAGTHRDVRAAVVGAARDAADDPGMWRVLRAAAASGVREDLRPILEGRPYLVPPARRAEYAALVLAAGTSPDRRLAAEGWAALAGWALWLHGAEELVLQRLTELADETVWPAVAGALVAIVRAGTAGTLLTDALDALTGLDGVRVDGRDRPARRRVETIVARLGEQRGLSAAARRTIGTAAASISTVDGFAPAAAGLLLAATDPESAGEVDRLARLLDGRPVLAARIAQGLGRRLEQHEPQPAIAERLARRAGTADGLLAVAYAAHGRRLGWPARWRELVEHLREHPAEEVRDAALEARLE
ncbi:hypothetical protein ABZS66_55935 [Dactylosporangium sp. NPDC005572]|uniref:hypothetical protein n=1 Tax=Dactylosporangium sp. NPDC005572 TaxID=3156889 RepID=UPI0033AE1CCC